MSDTLEVFNHLDLQAVAELRRARIHNVTTSEQNTLASTLGIANTGLAVYNVQILALFVWDGTAFVRQAVEVTGDIIFRGVLAAADYTGQALVHTEAGAQYAIGESGTLSITGVTTYTPSATVEAGDQILFVSPTSVYVTQRNDSQATEATLGNVRLATQAEVTAGNNDTAALTPYKLATQLKAKKSVLGYFESVTLVAGLPKAIVHNLGLVDRDAFTVNVMRNNQAVSVTVQSVDTNTLTITSLVALAAVKVSVHGFVNPA